MSWGFDCAVTGGGRGLLLRRAGQSVAELVFGLPGEPVEGWESDESEARITAVEHGTVRLRHVPDPEGWTTVVSLDNTDSSEQALPPLGMVVTVHDAWTGWAWTSDTEGLVVLAPRDAPGPALLVRVRQGFLRTASGLRAFTPLDRRGDALGDGVALFHLANPAGSLRPFGRHQTTLEFEEVTDLAAVRAVLPGWLPELVVAPGDDLRFETPDQAIVPGPGVRLTTEDTTSVLAGEAGHQEVAVHGVRGVQRLTATFVPPLEPFLAGLVAALKSRRPSGVSSASGAVIAAALARRAVIDPEAALDWLEREDWLARGDLFGPAIAAVVAVESHDEALLEAACDAVLGAEPEVGLGMVATRCWLATLRMGLPPLDLTRVFARATTPEAAFEAALLRNADADLFGPRVHGIAHRFGDGVLPGLPVGLSEADAGLLVALLRFVPEGWPAKAVAAAAAERGSALLLADHAGGQQPGHEGLAWLLLGEIGA